MTALTETGRAAPLRAPRRLDAHVHLVGNGSSGSGCEIAGRGVEQWLAPFMLHSLGLPVRTLRGDLDNAYRERLLELVRASSLDAVVLFAQDKVYRDDGTVWTDRCTFHVPNDYVLQLARAHPEFLPAVSIHPGRPDAIEELERCLAGGAVALKLLPNCHNVDCALPRYRRFWERMAVAGLPFIAHTGSEFTVAETRPDLAHPHNLRVPLECGVKVIAAHCATGLIGSQRDWFWTWVAMLPRYPNLYGDLSALSLIGRDRWLPVCLRPDILPRVLHGSDLPVPVHGWPSWLRGRIGWSGYLALRRESNPLERACRLMSLLGFPAETFIAAEKVLRLPAGPA